MQFAYLHKRHKSISKLAIFVKCCRFSTNSAPNDRDWLKPKFYNNGQFQHIFGIRQHRWDPTIPGVQIFDAQKVHSEMAWIAANVGVCSDAFVLDSLKRVLYNVDNGQALHVYSRALELEERFRRKDIHLHFRESLLRCILHMEPTNKKAKREFLQLFPIVNSCDDWDNSSMTKDAKKLDMKEGNFKFASANSLEKQQLAYFANYIFHTLSIQQPNFSLNSEQIRAIIVQAAAEGDGKFCKNKIPSIDEKEEREVRGIQAGLLSIYGEQMRYSEFMECEVYCTMADQNSALSFAQVRRILHENDPNFDHSNQAREDEADVDDAVGILAAFKLIEDEQIKIEDLTVGNLLQIHQRMLQSDPLSAGKLRSQLQNCDDNDTFIHGVPWRPPGWQHVDQELHKFIAFVRWASAEVRSGRMHVLEFGAAVHIIFMLVQPFKRANGRMARLLMNMAFMQSSAPQPFPLLIVPHELNQHYRRAIAQTFRGDVRTFMDFIEHIMCCTLLHFSFHGVYYADRIEYAICSSRKFLYY